MSILFIHPPVAKPCEPPGGIAKLVGVLRRHGVVCDVLDANLEGLLWLMDAPMEATDPWDRRAVRDREQNLARIRNRATYGNMDRYIRTVADLNRLVAKAVIAHPMKISLADYQDETLAPVRSADLLQAAEHPERNPFFPFFAPRLSALMEQREPQLAGISLNYLSQALCAFAMAGFLRHRWPDVPVIMGGGLVTSWMRGGVCSDPFTGLVDQMVAGAGEGPLLAKLCPKTAPASSTLCKDEAVPDYNLFPVRDYLAPGLILPYSASQGCYWNRCAFCPEPAEGNRFLPKRHSHVVVSLAGLVHQHRPALIHLLDNAVSPALMQGLIRRPPGAPWYGFARFARNLTEEDFCRDLRRSGCVMLKIGLESGDQGVLDAEGKGVDLQLASRILANLRKASIATYVYLLFGTPSESEHEARSTLEFTARHAQHIDFLNLAIFNLPLAGRVRKGLEIMPHSEGDLSLYAGFRHPKGWDRGRVRRFLDREFKRHPAIAAILRHDPPFFTSNHAPFFSDSI